jgi:hypothetical protein
MSIPANYENKYQNSTSRIAGKRYQYYLAQYVFAGNDSFHWATFQAADRINTIRYKTMDLQTGLQQSYYRQNFENI